MRRILPEVGPTVVLALVASTTVGLAARVLEWRVLAAPGPSRMAVVAVCAGVAAVTIAARSPSRTRSQSVGSLVVASVPAVLLATFALTSLLWPLSERIGWFLGGDHVRHLVFVAQARADGALDYSTNEYPRAWHVFIAILWSALGGQQDRTGLLDLMALLSLAVWALHALMSLSIGQLAASLGRRCGLDRGGSGGAGLVAGAVTLWPTFLTNYQILGFENSILAVVLLAVAAREVLERAATTRALVITSGAVAVMVHTWQLLMPAALVAAGASTLAVLRRDRRRVPLVALVGIGTAVIASPGVMAAVTKVGIQSAVNAGVPAPLPAVVLPVALTALLFVCMRWRNDLRILALGAMVVVVIVGAFALAAHVHIPITQYYPAKMVWTGVVLALAPLGVLVVVLVRAAWSQAGYLGLTLRTAIGATALLGITFSVFGPAMTMLGPSATADGPGTLGALTAPGAETAQVVWLPRATAEETRFDSTTTRLLLDFYTAGPGMVHRDQRSPSVAQECRQLRAAKRPTVLSSAPVDEVRRRYSCVGNLTVVKAGGLSS